MKATVTQLTRLPPEILWLHLSSHHVVSTSTKTIMARQLHQAIHQASPHQTTASMLAATSAMTILAPQVFMHQLTALSALQCIHRHSSSSHRYHAIKHHLLMLHNSHPHKTLHLIFHVDADIEHLPDHYACS